MFVGYFEDTNATPKDLGINASNENSPIDPFNALCIYYSSLYSSIEFETFDGQPAIAFSASDILECTSIMNWPPYSWSRQRVVEAWQLLQKQNKEASWRADTVSNIGLGMKFSGHPVPTR